ncbi:GLPGLI family protein [Pedobacter sp. PWIIR3]
MKKLLSTLFCLVIAGNFNSIAQQNKFITSGSIEFERTANMFALVKKKVTKSTLDVKPHYEQYLRTEPQFRTLKSNLVFSEKSTLFTPVPPERSLYYQYDSPMANQLNIVYSNLAEGTSTIQKDFYERTFLVKDKIRAIKWKITDETRIIAGYNCRRANALVLDSIYVVAFYTDEIHVSGGPESFNGLPGMILGVAVPHENVTWFATKVIESPVAPKSIEAPKKGKVVNNKELFDDIMKAISNTGEYAIVALKGLLL